MNSPWGAWLHSAGTRSFALPGAAWLRHVPFVLFVASILAYGAAFAWYLLTAFDLADLLLYIGFDDAFYYLQIAYHMAEGRFSTFDGGLTRTNGYHPLWMFLLTPLHWVFDKTEAFFAAKALEIMLVAGGVVLVAAAARVSRLPWILLFAALPALYAQTGMLLGMEAALVLFMLGLLMLAMCLFARDPVRWRWPLAVVAFALPWARLECAAVAVAATAALGFLEWSGRFPAQPSLPLSRARSAWRLRSAVPFAGALAGVLVYFAYNGIVFGGVVPVSGALKALSSQREWERDGGYSLAASVEAFAQSKAFDDELLTALEVCAYALLVWWLARGSRSREDVLLLAFLAGAVALAAGHLAKFAQSVLAMHPSYQPLHPWYFVPAYLLEALVVPLRCCVGIYLVRRFLAPQLPRAADVLRLAAIVAALAVLAARADFAEPFRVVDAKRDDVGEGEWTWWNVRSYMGTAVMDRLLPAGTLVGSWDSGAIGYFSRLPVMNLDGMVNSYGYKEALEDGSIDTFLSAHGLFHFGNVYLDLLDPSAAGGAPERQRLLFKTARGSRLQLGGLQFKLWRSDPEWASSPVDRAAWFWERMTPHLELQADDVGLLVEGRMAQAFAWDCTANGDEVAAWTFAGEVEAVSGWTQTADGLCATDILLPHDHPRPVRVRRATLHEAVAGLAGGGPPAISAGGFDVYLGEDAVFYVKEACEQVDVETRFFLHLFPVGDDWDEDRESFGFNVLDFMLGHRGDWFGEEAEAAPCLVEVPLPRYPIAKIKTGQYVSGNAGTVWEGEIRLAQPTSEGA